MRLTLSLIICSLTFSSAWSQENAVAKEAIAKIQASGASLVPLFAQAKGQYRFTALNVAKSFNDESLSMLAPLADQIVALDLAKTQVTDAGLAQLTGMKQLKELHLENTAITDVGLAKLASFTELEYLNLYGTKVTDAGLKSLSGLTKLKSLYLWQTAVTKLGVTDLHKTLASTQINSGWSKEDDAKVVAATATAVVPVKAAAPQGRAPATVTTPAVSATTAGNKLDEAVAAKTIIFKDVIMPIVSEKCVACHGEKKSKGKLKMHTFADIMKGGSEGDVNVVVGKPADSLMLKRVALPEDDDEHMPPSDEKQMTKEEVQLVTWWIEQGASESLNVKAAKRSPEIDAILAALLKSGESAPAAEKHESHEEKAPAKAAKVKPVPLTDAEKKAIAEVTKKLNASQAVLIPVSQDTPLLRLSTVNASAAFGDQELALLAPIAARVAIVDIARTQVTDTGLSILSQFTALERLHLENTKISDATLIHLAGLKNLEYLNLYGTKVTDAGIVALRTCTALSKLYVWQTAVSADAAKALEAKTPALKVYLGLTETDIAQITAISKAAAQSKAVQPKVAKPKPKDKKAK